MTDGAPPATISAPRCFFGALMGLVVSGVELAADSGGPDVNGRALQRIANPPLGLPDVPIPEANPPTTAKIRLGRKLFFDRRLSHDGTMSCGMCHIPEQGFTNNELATAVGAAGQSLPRNAPTVYNVAYFEHLFHDGGETRLETQVISPLIADREMANPSIGHVVAKLEQLPDYRSLFDQAFSGGPSIERIGRAIASWERSLLSGNSAFDRWYYGGDDTALTPRAIEGFCLFSGKAGCAVCHRIGEHEATFTDDAFHDTGIGYARTRTGKRQSREVPVRVAPGLTIPLSREAVDSVSDPRQPDRGRYEVTRDPDDLWRFKTPGLRNVALTAPYMHDGSLRTLEEVVRFYNAGGEPYPGLDPAIEPLGLDDSQIAALVELLENLTGDNVSDLTFDARSVSIGN